MNKSSLAEQPSVGVGTPLFVTALILLSINFRAAIVALAPIVGVVQEAIGTTRAEMGIIGALPVFAFAVASPFAARLSRRYGIENTIIGGLGLVVVGGIIRSLVAAPLPIMIGTFILSCGIAFGAVVLAAAIRRDQPTRIEKMSSLQMFAFSIMASITAALSIPLNSVLGWQITLGIWSLLPIPAIFAWWKIKQCHKVEEIEERERPKANILKSKLAWLISLYVGLQSFIFFSFLTWLPTIAASRGFSPEESGLFNTLFLIIALPTVVIITPIAEKYPRIDILLALGSIFILIGVAGFMYGPVGLVWLFAALIGSGCTATFTFCLMLFSMRGGNAAESAALSGMAQTVGFLLASVGPFLVGWMSDISGGWESSTNLFIAISVVLIGLGYKAGRPGTL